MRFSDPITYVLSRLKSSMNVEMFDVLHAFYDWKKIKSKKPVAYADIDHKGKLTNLRLEKREDDNPYTTVGLYLE